MSGAEFKELVRRTFQLKLTPAEVGAVFEQFNATDDDVRIDTLLILLHTMQKYIYIIIMQLVF
jgi:hypothetical protein